MVSDRLPEGSLIRRWRKEHCKDCVIQNRTECQFLLRCMEVQKIQEIEFISEQLIALRNR